MNFLLQAQVTKAASYSGNPLTFGGAGMRALKSTRELVITLDVASAERDTGDETYDVYITTSDGVSSWDIAHFPQVASTGAKRFTARVNLDPPQPQNVTTASPGVAANDEATLKTDTAGADQGTKTLAAGAVRHGTIGQTISHELVVAGTVVTGIKYSIQVQAQ